LLSLLVERFVLTLINEDYYYYYSGGRMPPLEQSAI